MIRRAWLLCATEFVGSAVPVLESGGVTVLGVGWPHSEGCERLLVESWRLPPGCAGHGDLRTVSAAIRTDGPVDHLYDLKIVDELETVAV